VARAGGAPVSKGKHLIGTAAIAAASALTGCGGASWPPKGSPVEVVVTPVRQKGFFGPEGPVATALRVRMINGGTRWRRVANAIPSPLPKPLDQGRCNSGVDVVIVLSSGKSVTYGPCRVPHGISPVEKVMIAQAAHRT